MNFTVTYLDFIYQEQRLQKYKHSEGRIFIRREKTIQSD